jgi:osmotically-inducible protein OsmY
MKTLRVTWLTASLACCLFVLTLHPSILAQSASQTAPDNSKQNKNQQDTADNQTNAKSDRLITAQIRKAIVGDKTLSTYGHNVKIITVNGAVTLKGPVSSEAEKQKVVADATAVVTSDKLTDQLTVKQ